MAELLVLLLFLGGVMALGYLLAILFPPGAVRRYLDDAPRSEEDLRQGLRMALRAPPSATDLDLVVTVFEMRHDLERLRPATPDGGQT